MGKLKAGHWTEEHSVQTPYSFGFLKAEVAVNWVKDRNRNNK